MHVHHVQHDDQARMKHSYAFHVVALSYTPTSSPTLETIKREEGQAVKRGRLNIDQQTHERATS
jgi:hypothetical protein